jgi:DNA anti-recombination protein RmuC
MKRSLLLSLIMLCSSLGIGLSQNFSSEDREHRHHRSERSTPEERAEIQSKELTLALDLSSSQQEELRKSLLEFHTELKGIRDGFDKPFKDLSRDDKHQLKSKMLDVKIAFKKDMKQVLSTEQYERFDTKMLMKDRQMKQQRSRKRK